MLDSSQICSFQAAIQRILKGYSKEDFTVTICKNIIGKRPSIFDSSFFLRQLSPFFSMFDNFL